MKKTMKSSALKLAFLALGGATLLAGCQTTEGKPLSEAEQQQWAENFTEGLITNEVSIQDGITELEEHIAVVEDEEFSNALEVFLYTLEVQADRYNTILSNMTPEIDDVFKDNEEISFKSEEGWKKVKDGLVTGLRKEVSTQPLKWVEDGESVRIEIDYAKIDESFGDGMTGTLNNKIALSQHRVKKPDFDYENLHLNFANIWERLMMLEDFKESGDWDSSLDDQYYYLTSIIYGFGEGTMNVAEGQLNETAIEAMRAVAEENKDHPTAQNMLKVIAKMEEEGSSNDAVLDFTNALMNEQFADYLKEVEETVEEGTETATDEVAESAKEVEGDETKETSESDESGNISAAGGE